MHDTQPGEAPMTATGHGEGRYQALVGSAADAIVTADGAGTITAWNAAAQRIFGYSADEAVGAPVTLLMPEEHGAGHPDAMRRFFSGAGTGIVGTVVELAGRRRDGSVFPIELSLASWSAGGAPFVTAIIRDVSDRHETERALRAREEHYRAIFEESPIAIEVYDADGRLLDVNPACLELFGAADAGPLRGFDLFADPNFPDEHKQRVRNGGRARYQGAFDFEAVKAARLYETSRSGTIWLDVAVTPISEGAPGYLVQVQDITDRKLAEDSLREGRRALEAALAAMADGLAITDAQGSFVDFNDAFVAFHRFAGKDSSPRSDQAYAEAIDLMTPDGETLPFADWAIPRALRGESETGLELDVRRRDTGETWTGSFTFAPIHDDGDEITGAIMVARDITSRKLADRLLTVPSEILEVIAGPLSLRETAQAIADALRRATDLDAVGLRLHEDGDYPFAGASGYVREFLDEEDHIAARDADRGLCRDEHGEIELECTCGMVISGQAWRDTHDCTPGGSIWTNDAESFLDVPTDEDPRVRPRNHCTREGYRSIAAVPLRGGDEILGLLHLADHRAGRFTPEAVRFFEGLGASIGVALLHKRAQEELAQSADELRRQVADTVKTLGAVVGMRDPYTASHERRVTALALEIARELGMDEERLEGLALASDAHDIGKVGVPAEILSKPTALSELEHILMRQHAETGREILGGIRFRQPVADIVGQHHERLDGSGYPRGLAGDEIMLEARILAVADVVEAMASHRPYRASRGVGAALDEVRDGAGTLYDPEVVEACERIFARGYTLPDEQ